MLSITVVDVTTGQAVTRPMSAQEQDEFLASRTPEPTVPSSAVSLRQLLRALVSTGFISRAEALAAARTGDIPASLSAPLFVAVDAEAGFEIELAWAAMYEAERASPFWAYVVAAGIATAEQIDEVFAVAAAS